MAFGTPPHFQVTIRDLAACCLPQPSTNHSYTIHSVTNSWARYRYSCEDRVPAAFTAAQIVNFALDDLKLNEPLVKLKLEGSYIRRTLELHLQDCKGCEE